MLGDDRGRSNQTGAPFQVKDGEATVTWPAVKESRLLVSSEIAGYGTATWRCRLHGKLQGDTSRSMPKMKTRKAAARRFKITGTGKVMRAKGMKSHNRRKKTKRTRRMFDRMYEVAPQDRQRIKRLLPYGTE